MKRLKLLSMLLALVLVFGSLLGTTALAATTTTATKVVAEAQADEADAQAAAEEGTQKKGLGKQMLILLAFAVGVGILASVYGLTTMRYNQEKMDDMTEESRKVVERMRDDNEYRNTKRDLRAAVLRSYYCLNHRPRSRGRRS